MVEADAAVVGQEDIGAARGDGEEAQHELRVLVDAAGRHGDELDAHAGADADRQLQRADDVGLVVGRRVEDEEGQSRACLRVPRQLLQHLVEGRVHRLGIVAAAHGLLLADVVRRLADLRGEVAVLRHVFVALVTIEEGCRAQRQRGAGGRSLVDDVDQVALQEVDLVRHRARGVDDEGDVGLRLHVSRSLDDVAVDGRRSHRVPPRHLRMALHQLRADAHREGGRVGRLLLVESGPEAGLAAVVGLRLPEGLVAPHEGHVGADDGASLSVAEAHGHAVVGVELPVGRLVAEILRFHQPRPEGPVAQVVPFAGRDDARLRVAIAAAAQAGRGVAGIHRRDARFAHAVEVVRLAVPCRTCRCHHRGGQHHQCRQPSQ